MTHLRVETEGRIAAIRRSVDWIRNADTRDTHQELLGQTALALLDGIAPTEGLLEALRRIVAAEKLIRLALELKTQGTLDIAKVLQFARAAARESYQLGIRAARALGVRASAARDRWPEPAVLLEPMATPATYVRGASTRTLGFTDRGVEPIPFPIVLIPWYPEHALGSLCILHHEVGHNLDQDLGITEGLGAAIATRLAQAQVAAARVDIWKGWCREIVADAFGLMFAGTALHAELRAWASELEEHELASQTHPYPWVRVELAREVLAILGVDAGEPAPAAPRGSERAGFLEQARLVAHAVLEAPLSALAGGSMQDLAPATSAEHATLAELAPDVHRRKADLGRVPFRLIPSLARLAVDANPRMDPAEITKVLFDHAATRGDPGAIPFRQELYRRHTLRTLVTPMLDEEQGGLKRPPPDLFARARTISFVGATNDSLPKLFADYRGPRKDRIDIFFLSVPAVQRLATKTKPAEALAKLRGDALEALDAAALSRVATRWRVLIHDEPYFFAAYFDAAAPGGRIHVSSHGWGQDIKRAPSADHVWPEGDPSPGRTYAWYLEALNGLHERATLLRSGE